MSPDGQDGEDAESPMPNPSQISQTVRRRGAISAEPITEEDVATYVKKVLKNLHFNDFFLNDLIFFRWSQKTTRPWPHCQRPLPKTSFFHIWTKTSDQTSSMPCFPYLPFPERSLFNRATKEITFTSLTPAKSRYLTFKGQKEKKKTDKIHL